MYERIRALREDRDLSQKQLSQALHCFCERSRSSRRARIRSYMYLPCPSFYLRYSIGNRNLLY